MFHRSEIKTSDVATHLTTHYTVHTVSVITQKLFRLLHPRNDANMRMRRRSNIAFIANISQMCCRKNSIVIFSLKGNIFSVKLPKKCLKTTLTF